MAAHATDTGCWFLCLYGPMEDFLPNRLMFRGDSMVLWDCVSNRRHSIRAGCQSAAPANCDADVGSLQREQINCDFDNIIQMSKMIIR